MLDVPRHAQRGGAVGHPPAGLARAGAREQTAQVEPQPILAKAEHEVWHEPVGCSHTVDTDEIQVGEDVAPRAEPTAYAEPGGIAFVAQEDALVLCSRHRGFEVS